MTPALWFFVVALAVILIVDLAFWLRLLPGGSISQGIYRLSLKRPILWHLGYIALVAFGYWHFFG